MTYLVYFIVIILLLVFNILLIIKYINGKDKNSALSLQNGFLFLEKEIRRIESSVREEIAQNRMELSSGERDSRRELKEALEGFRKELTLSLNSFAERQRDNFGELNRNQATQNQGHSEKLSEVKTSLETSLRNLNEENSKKLEEMRATVDEKLQKTLESRLSESFKLVSERLEAVHKGLGDMQNLATGVGDLKKVLSNVKTRGILGEYQLENLLEQLLTAEQYGKNIKTKKGSNALVEFAVKLPGREEKEGILWLPIDSKFPKEDFELLHQAYELGSPELIEENRKNFVRGIKKCAADIRDKYIDPPNTTDFALLFLPFESLYAEVLRTPGLFESIQKDYKIILTGPTTLSALLSSLQMGFRTLAIEKRSGEVWSLLSSVKTEFSTFGDILIKTKKKLQEASNVIEQAEGSSRRIVRKLKDVQALPQHSSDLLVESLEPIRLDAGNESSDPEQEMKN